MVIEQASLRDIPTIRSIAFASWPVAYKEILSTAQLAYMLDLMYSEASLTEQLTARGHQFLLAEMDRTSIGFAGFEHHCSGERSTRLHKLYVLPDAQGNGAGRALLNAVQAAAREAGDAQVELNVNRFNPSRAWYERHGFRFTRNEVIDIGSGYVMDDYVMVRSIDGAR